MDAERISGTLAAAVTPLRDDGSRLDAGAFEPLLEFYAAAGLDGVLVLGTTGEGILLTAKEREGTAELAVAESEGPEAGLRMIDDLDLDEYRYLHEARGEMLRRHHLEKIHDVAFALGWTNAFRRHQHQLAKL